MSNLSSTGKTCLIPSFFLPQLTQSLQYFSFSIIPGHSTETALLKVVDDLFLSLSIGNMSTLTFVDFSSAFDTIDHYPYTPSVF